MVVHPPLFEQAVASTPKALLMQFNDVIGVNIHVDSSSRTCFLLFGVIDDLLLEIYYLSRFSVAEK